MTVHFSSAGPVTGESFYNREGELRRLLYAARDLKAGIKRYYALIGMRKVGKTSVLREFARLVEADRKIVTTIIDCNEACVSPTSFFSEYVVRVIDAYLMKSGTAKKTGLLAGAALDDAQYLTVAANVKALGLNSLGHGIDVLFALARPLAEAQHKATCVAAADLPESIGQESGLFFVVILDEFQRAASLNGFKETKRVVGDIFAFLRSRWQGHSMVNYWISGSEISLMEQILNREASPFFQQFATMRVASFSDSASRKLLIDLFEKSNYSVSQDLIQKMVELTGGNPFYLQVMGEELCKNAVDKDPDVNTLKTTLQEVLFNPGGRLYSYCEALFSGTVRSSSSLERTLAAIASKHQRPTAISRKLRIPVGTANSYLVRLIDLDLIKKTDTSYDFVDPLFRLWVAGTKTPLKSMISPYTLGTETEKLVAERLSREGFYVLFAPASRGAFDLLAILNSTHVGVQVKRSSRDSYYLSQEAYQRMVQTSRKLRWFPALAIVSPDMPQVRYFPLERLQRSRKAYRMDETTESYSTLSELVFSGAA